MKKHIAYLLSGALMCVFAACSDVIDGGVDISDDIQEAQLITLPVNIGVSDYEFDVDTKALKPYIPDVENLIFDIWVVQYSSRGVLLPRSIYHYRTGETVGDLKVTDLYVAGSTSQGVQLVESAEDCTVCFLVNMGGNVPEWPDNLISYQEIMMPVLDADPSVALKRTPMCGFYRGPVTNGSQVTVSLGRMVARLNVILNNKSNENISGLEVRLDNVPRYAHIFPHINTIPFNAAEDSGYRILKDSGISISAGGSKNLYYYTAPNLYADLWPTTMTVSCHLDSSNKNVSGVMVLGDDRPSVTDDRDLRLYPNNQYTFTVNLVNNE